MSATLQEHIGYISDAERLARFREAIALAVSPGDIVVDVGCGFAPLGLLCLEAGAARVYGIDRTDAIEIARETVARAGYADRYTCIRDHSFRTQLPEQADVVICDHVGYFGFDYGVIDTLGDARRRFLKPGGKVIPGRIDLKVAGVTSAACMAKARAWSAPGIPEAFHWLDEYTLNSRHPVFLKPADVVTAPVDLGAIDLAIDNADHMGFSAELVAAHEGALDGLGGWFDCEIAQGVRMSNSPLIANPIYRDQVFLPFSRPLPVRPGDRIAVRLNLRHDVTAIAWTARNLTSGEQRRQSTWAGQILSEADRTHRSARVPVLSPVGKARRLVLDYVDGQRTAEEIEAAVLRDHPDLFPSPREIAAFVRGELARGAA